MIGVFQRENFCLYFKVARQCVEVRLQKQMKKNLNDNDPDLETTCRRSPLYSTKTESHCTQTIFPWSVSTGLALQLVVEIDSRNLRNREYFTDYSYTIRKILYKYYIYTRFQIILYARFPFNLFALVIINHYNLYYMQMLKSIIIGSSKVKRTKSQKNQCQVYLLYIQQK